MAKINPKIAKSFMYILNTPVNPSVPKKIVGNINKKKPNKLELRNFSLQVQDSFVTFSKIKWMNKPIPKIDIIGIIAKNIIKITS